MTQAAKPVAALKQRGQVGDKDDAHLGGGAADAARPGWSTTSGIARLEAGDYPTEFGAHAPLDVNSQAPVDMVRKPPCDR